MNMHSARCRRAAGLAMGLAALAAALAAAAPAPAEPRPAEAERFFVGFEEAPAAAERALVERAGGHVVRSFPEIGALAVRIPESRIGHLAAARGVAYVEREPRHEWLGLEDAQLVPSLDNGLYGLVTTKATGAHSRGRTGAGIKACVADTGIDYTQPDIAAAYRGGTDTVDNDGDPWWNNPGSAETHGTHVAGTVVAANDAQGVLGVAYGAQLYHARVGNNDGPFSADIMEGIRWLVETAGCKVVNLSAGSPYGSRTEQNFYNDMRRKGALIVASAGNEGGTTINYPARYGANVAVGAVDTTNARAAFSNTGSALDVSAPGVLVLSAVPGTVGRDASLSTAAGGYGAYGMEFSGPTDGLTGLLVDCGLALAASDCPAAVAGNVALVQRGQVPFSQKVENAMNAGAAAVIVYNNAPGDLSSSLRYEASSDGRPWIPAVTVSDTTGAALKSQLGTSATIVNRATFWHHFSGTSMAAPHVTGVIALIWSVNPSLSNSKVEDHLFATATDLGAAGYDTTYGYGLVNAEAAVVRAGG